jgi:tRNA-splicing ligase RtcB
MTSRKSSSSTTSDKKAMQVCAAVERIVSSSLAADFDNPILHGVEVRGVYPAPSMARLLVMVSCAPGARAAVEDVLLALDHVRSHLRREVATELNHKRSPELSFTVVPRDAQLSPAPVEPPVVPAPPLDAAPLYEVPSRDAAPLRDAAAPRDAAPSLAPTTASWARALPHARTVISRGPKTETPRNLRRTLRREAKLRARRQSGSPVQPSIAMNETTPTDGVPIKHWTRGVPVEEGAMRQLANIAKLPIVYGWVAAMPDVHVGIGATVGSVIPTRGAIIPAAVGVDIGCGMMALRTTLTASQLPDSLSRLRGCIERGVPHGRGRHGGRGDTGSWSELPDDVGLAWKKMEPGFERLAAKHPALGKSHHNIHLGTLGTGNHFIELCLDETERVWVMLHSGSRGVGNRIGTYFIELAKRDMERHMQQLPDKDLAYFSEGAEHFDDYVEAVSWAQNFARENRELMMRAVLSELVRSKQLPDFETDQIAVNCHHNYVAKEQHLGHELFVTRKGAVSAQLGELGIIPGSMGARSFIVSGKGNAESFCSCSHGAGRRMSRTEAKRRFTLEDHKRMTEGVECRKDEAVIDETPAAYKDIAAVMAAQSDLVQVEHTLKQVLCVKG